MSFQEQAEKLIAAEVRMISGCADSQTSADVSNVKEFELPDPAGKAGGACTSALLNILYNDGVAAGEMSWVDMLRRMRVELQGDYTQVPQLSSSRQFDLSNTFEFAKTGYGGTKRAVLIGINYVGQSGQLSGCHNDVLNIQKYIMDVHGFQEENIEVLMDDGYHTSPTRHNITVAYQRIAEVSQSGDAVFCHYSGHGGKLPDDNGDEDDGYDETLIPVDYEHAGQMRDDELLQRLVLPLRAGVTMFSLMDCCHSGTILDLPYRFRADGDTEEFQEESGYNFGGYMGLLGESAETVFCCFMLLKFVWDMVM
eukprot:CAMPEP_0194279434 /NCGR_PEP_ID=MMETSP0169-20130528/13925_1 /TAXON_ID=218684 /ORGANISM="Corethron pennatum, Strain L29A3" /LENGTH=309 /DNA_ID=CAMNT_0039023855 /DNA_START=130 /DNA_END=1059 /DNA_ORIENTATION=-